MPLLTLNSDHKESKVSEESEDQSAKVTRDRVLNFLPPISLHLCQLDLGNIGLFGILRSSITISSMSHPSPLTDLERAIAITFRKKDLLR